MAESNENEHSGRDFIRQIVAADVEAGTHGGEVVTRFPPEPNGFLHIGHPSAICLDFDVAEEFGGRCHLRFDDTNPESEEMRFVEAMIEDIRWLGFDWGDHLYFASDYFERLYEYAVELIEKGLAYVDSQTLEEIRENRGTVTEPGTDSRYRDRSVEENLDLFRRMREGEFEDGAHVLRAKIDMTHPNMIMRDPVLYRIRHATHYRAGDEWCIYPLYDFTHCLSDSIEGITHSFCTLEFVPNRAIYDWLLDNLDVPRPQPRQFEFARLNLDYTVTSKRKLAPLVNEGVVSGWDDPRMPTVRGLRRRGYTADAIKAFVRGAGITKVDKRIDVGKLEYAIRTDLNDRAPRVMAILDPLKVVLTNYSEHEVELLDAPYFPRDIGKEGARTVPFSRELYIERADFAEDPPKGFFRLVPGGEVRLRYGYVIQCEEVVKDDDGKVVELHCTYDPETRGGDTPDGRKVKGTIQWVAAADHLVAEVRLYDRLFGRPDPEELEEDETVFDALNPDSLVVIRDALVERSLKEAGSAEHFQFERTGYFFTDPHSSKPGAPVFNRVVTLKDSWARQQKDAAPAEPKPVKKAAPAPAPQEREYRPTDPDDAARFDGYRELGLEEPAANVLAVDRGLGDFFDAARAHTGATGDLANWIINELPRVLPEEGSPADLPFGPTEMATLVDLVADEAVSGRGAREVLEILARDGGDPATIVEDRGLARLADTEVLGGMIDEVMEANPDKVAAYRDGKTGLSGFFMGQVMRRTQGRADGEVLQKLVQEKLEG